MPPEPRSTQPEEEWSGRPRSDVSIHLTHWLRPCRSILHRFISRATLPPTAASCCRKNIDCLQSSPAPRENKTTQMGDRGLQRLAGHHWHHSCDGSNHGPTAHWTRKTQGVVPDLHPKFGSSSSASSTELGDDPVERVLSGTNFKENLWSDRAVW